MCSSAVTYFVKDMLFLRCNCLTDNTYCYLENQDLETFLKGLESHNTKPQYKITVFFPEAVSLIFT